MTADFKYPDKVNKDFEIITQDITETDGFDRLGMNDASI